MNTTDQLKPTPHQDSAHHRVRGAPTAGAVVPAHPRRGRHVDRGPGTPLERPPRRLDAPAAPGRRPTPSALRDPGVALLLVFLGAVLVMVGAVAVAALVGRWWILVPVMCMHFAATFAVLACIARLLGDGNDDGSPMGPAPPARWAADGSARTPERRLETAVGAVRDRTAPRR